jgi:hypothetical protein
MASDDMTWYLYDPHAAVNVDGDPVQSGSFNVYAIADITFTTPLTVRDPITLVEGTVVTVTDYIHAAFEVETHTRVWAKSGVAPACVWMSAQGMETATLAAQAAASQSAIDAAACLVSVAAEVSQAEVARDESQAAQVLAEAAAATQATVSVLSYGAVEGGVVDCTAAFAAALATGWTVFVPPGTWLVNDLPVAGDATIVGAGQGATVVASSTGSVLVLSGASINVSDLTLYATAAHTVTQSASVSQCHWARVNLIQTHDDFSMWDNAGHEFVDMRFDHGSSSHTQTATVPTWALSAVGGVINANVWESWRADRSGNYHWLVESTSANAQYQATWRNITFEICTGGGIKLRSVRGYTIDGYTNWDMASGTPTTGQQHFIDAGANGSGIVCVGMIRNAQRLAGVNAVGVYDVVLPASGLGNGTILEACRNVSGADPFTVDCKSQYVIVSNPHGDLASFLNAEAASFLPDAVGTIRLATATLTGGTGSPEGVVTAVPGSLFMRTNGSAAATTYLKRTGTGNTGWAAVTSATELAGKVDTAAWTPYTPTLGGAGTSLGDGVATGAWVNLGGVIHFYASITLGASTVFGTGVQVGLPAAMLTGSSYAALSGVATDTGSGTFMLTGIAASSTAMAMFGTAGGLVTVDATHPHTWAATDVIELRGTYRPA